MRAWRSDAARDTAAALCPRPSSRHHGTHQADAVQARGLPLRHEPLFGQHPWSRAVGIALPCNEWVMRDHDELAAQVRSLAAEIAERLPG